MVPQDDGALREHRRRCHRRICIPATSSKLPLHALSSASPAHAVPLPRAAVPSSAPSSKAAC